MVGKLIKQEEGRKKLINREIDKIVNLSIGFLFLSPFIALVVVYAIALPVLNILNFPCEVQDSRFWISFIGSILGGVITLFAVLFTIRSNEINNDRIRNERLQPFINLSITKKINKDNKNQIKVVERKNDYDYIEVRVENLTSNIIRDFSVQRIDRNRDKFLPISPHDKDLDSDIFDVYGKCEIIKDTTTWSFNFPIPKSFDTSDQSSTIIHTFSIFLQFSDVIRANMYQHICKFTIIQIINQEGESLETKYTLNRIENFHSEN